MFHHHDAIMLWIYLLEKGILTMKKWNIAVLLLLVVTMLFSVAFATETTSPLPDISTLNADQLKQLKEAINTRLTDLGELYEEI